MNKSTRNAIGNQSPNFIDFEVQVGVSGDRFYIILYASHVPTSPDTMEANSKPEPVNLKFRNIIVCRGWGVYCLRFGTVFVSKIDPRGSKLDPKSFKNVPGGGPGEVLGDPGGAEKPKLKRGGHQEEINLNPVDTF